jgi:hypothetical protein
MSFHPKAYAFKGCPFVGSLWPVMAMLVWVSCRPAEPKETSWEQAWFTGSFVAPSGAEMDGSGRVIRFYGNGRYTMYGNQGFSFGNWFWSTAKNCMSLEPDSGRLEASVAFWQCDKPSGRDRKAEIFREASLTTSAYEGSYSMQSLGSRGNSDPFSENSNAWRHKPNAPETSLEIKDRVLGYLYFLEDLYKFAIINQLDNLPTQWFPQPVLMHYGNGVRMAYSDELDDWNACFYNTAQAVTGYQYLSGVVPSLKIENTNKRFERNRDIVQQLITLVKETKPLPLAAP